MAEEAHGSGGGDWDMVYFVGGIILILTILWFVRGMPDAEQLKGIFLQPPPPFGSGESYGPEIPDPYPSQQGESPRQ